MTDKRDVAEPSSPPEPSEAMSLARSRLLARVDPACLSQRLTGLSPAAALAEAMAIAWVLGYAEARDEIEHPADVRVARQLHL